MGFYNILFVFHCKFSLYSWYFMRYFIIFPSLCVKRKYKREKNEERRSTHYICLVYHLLKSKLIIDHRLARFSSVLLISLGFNESACVTILNYATIKWVVVSSVKLEIFPQENNLMVDLDLNLNK